MSTPISLAAVLVAASVLPGCASSDTYPVMPRIDLLGMPVIDQAAVQPAVRTIAITPATPWVNVTSGEVVRFTTGERSFTWDFQVSPNVAMFDLNQVAPPGALPRRVPVYVAPNPVFGTGG